MPQISAFEGSALRALAASARRPTLEPGSSPPSPADRHAEHPAERPRDRIWELAETLHCSIVGTCLTTEDGRTLMAKLNRPDARTMSEHYLHGQIVHLAGRREGGGKLLQKTLDRRHEREIRRFEAARTAHDVRALWRASLERGEIPGAYWAAITHPATDWALVQDIFGEVHMLSHLVGRANRADIRRLRHLEADVAARDETIADQADRIQALSDERDRLRALDRAAASDRTVAAAMAAPPPERETRSALEARLAREQAHAHALAAKLAALMQATERLGIDLEAEIARRCAAEAELAAIEAMLDETRAEPSSPSEPGRLDGRVLLYVGGRPRQVANLRRLVQARGGRLLCHDGGIEDSISLLPGLVGQSELVLFPVECVSHEATGMVKRACESLSTPYRPVRSASLASFVHALMPAQTPVQIGAERRDSVGASRASPSAIGTP